MALQVRLLVMPPVAVALKVVAVETVRVGAAGVMAVIATVCGVTVTVASCESPAASVARR